MARELNDNELEGVAGGKDYVIRHYAPAVFGEDKDGKEIMISGGRNFYEVIDDETRSSVGFYNTEREAIEVVNNRKSMTKDKN